MNKRLFILTALIIFYCSICSKIKAQSYTIESFEETKAKVSLSYKLFSKRLAISHLKDTLFLRNYQGTENVRILARRFLQIVYMVRCGSNCSAQNTVILSVNKGKINVAMLYNSHAAFEGFQPYEAHTYDTNFIMTNSKTDNYRLNIAIHDKYDSQSSPKSSYNLNQKVYLKFNSEQHIFYETKEIINKNFTTTNGRNQNLKKQNFSGAFPTIKLGSYIYYFIKGKWYSGYNELSSLEKDYYKASEKK